MERIGGIGALPWPKLFPRFFAAPQSMQYILRRRSIYCGAYTAARILRCRNRLPHQSKIWCKQSAFMRSPLFFEYLPWYLLTLATHAINMFLVF